MRSEGVADLLGPVLAPYDLDLEEVDITPAGKRRVVRVVVDGDGPDGRGPLLDDIADATKAISNALDTSELVGAGAYTLEVTSRGVGRPLTLPRHWRRNRGRLVEVRLAAAEAGTETVTGRIVAADDDHATLQVSPEEQLEISYPDVERAVVQVELNRKSARSDDDEGEEG